MDRKPVIFRGVLIAVLALGPLPWARAEDSPVAPPQSPSPAVTPPSTPPSPKRDGKSLQKLIQELTPEQKQRLSENLKTWKQLSPEQRQVLRDRDHLLKKRAEEEAAALANELTEEQRGAFQKRYIEERLQLEMALRQEFDLRRKTQIRELVERLRQELNEPPQKPAGESSKSP
jgi:hypothetical protein